MVVSPSLFSLIGSRIMRRSQLGCTSVQNRRFRAFFGVTPTVCCQVWLLLSGFLPRGSKPEHLLWACMFLKLYSTEHVHAALAGADEKTLRKWVWIIVCRLASLDIISWRSRLQGKAIAACYVSVDGTDFRIEEPTPFSSRWYSHKYKGPGLRYEVGLSLDGGKLVWVHGPFAPGEFPDVKIFRAGMKSALGAGEYVIADLGYTDVRCIKPGYPSVNAKLHSLARARHETVNERLKNFRVLETRFRHKLSLHSLCFHAVANLVHLQIEESDELLHVEF